MFADADIRGPEPFYLKKIIPAEKVGLSSHSIKPSSLIALVKESFNANIEAYVIGIRGYEFNDFKEELSEKASDNLKAALEFIRPVLKNKELYEFRAENVTW